ncbi:hydrolase [Paenarthrobacter aurescens]|uniref:Hydrolase n=1 Tax=Paenarthrobacter aurescens TaxID=43663 RepID=A0A4Y3NAU9_PAEAU|nr:hydrolase [Paenarthrobacter aurescens]MDO6143438.1 hydrolase [Paenarthrobacter aurescens]MDO6147286.1 hydrolase [Paenarthrobacter aurescens]MDO6158530.1 hydrolase [Paenarthrobacter aurescens]MDO6162513.1 hydrolase [Paenarthrobacter aurescens]GEB18257.1 hydrolase [Paenarthrobacter aurescens]
MLICATCAVERDEPLPELCPICADERQYVPEDGQRWLTMDELTRTGRHTVLEQNEPGLIGISTEPKAGIGQTAQLVLTPEGSLLWDPVGYIDDQTVESVLDHGPVLAIAASHPHMFGVQVEWSHRLGHVPVLVADADRQWLGRTDPCITFWSGTKAITEGLVLYQTGGHFPGSAVAHWAAGAAGKGVLLSGDSVFPNPDRRTVAFMRSYPNRLPLSGAVALGIAARLDELEFDRIYGNFNNVIPSGARGVVRESAQRHAAWTRGDFDHLT